MQSYGSVDENNQLTKIIIDENNQLTKIISSNENIQFQRKYSVQFHWVYLVAIQATNAKVRALSSQSALAAHAETVGTLLGTVCEELWIS